MKRRKLLFGGMGLAALGGFGLAMRPRESGGPHSPYFSALNTMLRQHGPGHPVMVIDLDRVNRNIDQLVDSVGPDKTYRVVVKSLPSVELVQHVMGRARTRALMLFHQPFINTIAERIPDADVLVGKPMPVSAAETFYKKFDKAPHQKFRPEAQLQWLIDSRDRLLQYQQLAQQLGVNMRLNFEIDVGLHRGGIETPEEAARMIDVIQADPRLTLSGLMGYEPHLTGMRADLGHPEVRSVLSVYTGFIDRIRDAGSDPASLTLNGAGSHTLRIYEKDRTMNDLSAGSAVVKPMDFDTYHLQDKTPALFIATPILKRYDSLKVPVQPALGKLLSAWDPNRRRLYYIYGGYWKARFVSPAGIPDPLFQSTNQEPVTTSHKVDLDVDDYMFLRPTQSEHVMLQFGDLLVTKQSEIVDRWPVFHQTG